MKSRDFVYWLQGFFELHSAGPKRPEPHDDMSLSGYQVELIRRHLALVFKHEIDPEGGDAEQQAILNTIHGPPKEKPQLGSADPLNPNFIMRC